MTRLRLSLLLLLLLSPAPVSAQRTLDLLRTSPRFLAAFREVAGRVERSVVRVNCDGTATALGSVISDDGLVLTKASDLSGKITCRLYRGQELPATVVGVNETHDLALLKIETQGLRPIEFAYSRKAKAGAWVISPGLGGDLAAVGVVSVPTRELPGGRGAIPDPAKAGYLGVGLEAADEGARVTQVLPETPAAHAGLHPEDVIVRIDGKAISDPETLIAELVRRKPGERIRLHILREESERDIEATLTSRPLASPRAEMQNHMGSELSRRRSGYTTILQHDSVLHPTDCGGPLVDLEGRVLGINISRAGRVETWAIPAEVVQEVLPELRAGTAQGTRPAGPRDADVSKVDRSRS